MPRVLFCVSLLSCVNFLLVLTVSGRGTKTPCKNVDINQKYSVWYCFCGEENKMSRIIGGAFSDPHQYPWMAAVCWSEACNFNTLLCGGSLINDQFILTAAHCVWGKTISNISVALGVHNLNAFEKGISENYGGEKFIIHPHYSPLTQNNDIALIKLKTKVLWSRNVLPICLPRKVRSYVNKKVNMAGWGDTTGHENYSTELKVASLKVISSAKCDELYGYTENTEHKLCTLGGTMDSCLGDSGGPLAVKSSGRYVQIGVLSWGPDCGEFQYPTVYSRVDRYLSWIRTMTLGSETCPKKRRNETGNSKNPFQYPIKLK